MADHHVNTHHTNKDTLTCTLPTCSDKPSFNSDRQFDSHLKEKHPYAKLRCNICAMDGQTTSFKKFSTFKVHRRDKHGIGATWTCPHCGQQFTLYAEYRQHLSWHNRSDKGTQRGGMLQGAL